MQIEQEIRAEYRSIMSRMNERQRRLWAGQQARTLGRGGIAVVARATGLARNTIVRGLAESTESGPSSSARVRCQGGGRKATTLLTPGLTSALEELLEPQGNRESPLRWTRRSTRQLAAKLSVQGYAVSHTVVAGILHDQDYCLQTNGKIRAGAGHPDYDAQFEHVNDAVEVQLKGGQPAIAVDIRERVPVRAARSARRSARSAIYPGQAQVRDITEAEKGRLIPYGACDLRRGVGWVSAGAGRRTAGLAVATILRWWRRLGRKRYGRAKSLLIIVDGGGGNVSGHCPLRWELQHLARQTGLVLSVCHIPPGIRKWSRIEHRLLSLGRTERRRHFPTDAVIVNLIAAANSARPRFDLVLDAPDYPGSSRLTADPPRSVNLRPDPFHGDWNFAILPRGSRG